MLQDKKAFTMLEAIMVIVVMGIIAAVAIPRLENDS
ncbi:MAG: type II secretion system protein, partial [Epsilonproteobacteria bacterium]|nr:type II secretion system protein [Campylobacterota bacterium]